jgi:hypothetical protein
MEECATAYARPKDKDDRADLLAAAEESLDRLAHLAASLLDVSPLQAGGCSSPSAGSAR